MKIRFLAIIPLVALVLAGPGCFSRDKQPEAPAEPVVTDLMRDGKYVANTRASKVAWTIGGADGSHIGTVDLSRGSLIVRDNRAKGGLFVIDMASLRNNDLPEEERAGLLDALASPAFLGVAEHPEAVFSITGSTEKEDETFLSGRLTLKGADRPLSVPVTVSADEGSITLDATFEVDRNEWGIGADIGDMLVEDEVKIDAHIVLAKEIEDEIEIEVE